MFSIEQQFEISKFRMQIAVLDEEQCRELLMELFMADILKSNAFIEMSKHHWFSPSNEQSPE
jgi:hypothetical protein